MYQLANAYATGEVDPSMFLAPAPSTNENKDKDSRLATTLRQLSASSGVADEQATVGAPPRVDASLLQVEALRWHHRGAEKGHAPSAYWLGALLAAGVGVEGDPNHVRPNLKAALYHLQSSVRARPRWPRCSVRVNARQGMAKDFFVDTKQAAVQAVVRHWRAGCLSDCGHWRRRRAV